MYMCVASRSYLRRWRAGLTPLISLFRNKIVFAQRNVPVKCKKICYVFFVLENPSRFFRFEQLFPLGMPCPGRCVSTLDIRRTGAFRIHNEKSNGTWNEKKNSKWVFLDHTSWQILKHSMEHFVWHKPRIF